MPHFELIVRKEEFFKKNCANAKDNFFSPSIPFLERDFYKMFMQDIEFLEQDIARFFGS